MGGWVSQETMSWHHCQSTAHLFPVCWWCHTFRAAMKRALRTDRELKITLNRKCPRPQTAMTSEPSTNSARSWRCINHSCESSTHVGEAFSGKPSLWKDHAGPSKPCVALQLPLVWWSTYFRVKDASSCRLRFPPAFDDCVTVWHMRMTPAGGCYSEAIHHFVNLDSGYVMFKCLFGSLGRNTPSSTQKKKVTSYGHTAM